MREINKNIPYRIYYSVSCERQTFDYCMRGLRRVMYVSQVVLCIASYME